MLETPDYPEIARVMRVTNPAQQIPPGVSIGDYEDADEMGDGDNEEDDGWGIVKSRKPRMLFSHFSWLATGRCS